jgi:hypothetical protein
MTPTIAACVAEKKITSTRYAVEAAIDGSKDRSITWETWAERNKNIATWGEIRVASPARPKTGG